MKTIRLLPLSLLLLPLSLLPLAVSAEEEEAAAPDYALALAIREVSAIREADRVVVAAVKEVHQSPGIWCGYLMTRQEVTYRVVRSVAGGAVEGDVRVGHLLVSGSSLVAKEAPYLRPGIFYPGARFLLCLNRDGEKWVVLDETFGARAIDAPRQPDPVRMELLRQVLLLPELREYFHPDVAGRVPVKVVLSEAVPVPGELSVLGERVEFLPSYLLRGAPHVDVTSLTIGDGEAVLRFTYDAEGAVGEARFSLQEGTYRLIASKVAER